MSRRDVFIGLAGACIGALVATVLVARKYEKILKIELDLTEQLIDEINRKEKVIVKDKKEPSIQEVADMEPDEQKKVIDKMVEDKRYKRDPVDYHLVNVEGEHTYKDKVDPSEIQSPPDGCDYAKDAYVISFEEFCEGAPGFGQETITYYAGDDTLADFNEEIIDNRDYVVGEEALTNFGMGEDPDVVYVRNEAMSVDYDIVRHHGCYKEIVGGL